MSAVCMAAEVKDGHFTTSCRLENQPASRRGLSGLWLAAQLSCCHHDGNRGWPVWSVSRRRSTFKQTIWMDRLLDFLSLTHKRAYLYTVNAVDSIEVIIGMNICRVHVINYELMWILPIKSSILWIIFCGTLMFSHICMHIYLNIW